MTMQDARNRERLEAEARRAGLTPTALEMSRAVGTDLIGDIVRDSRRSNPVRPSGMLPDQQTSLSASRPPIGENGWVSPPAIANWKPPGLTIMDRMMDTQDAIDRAERSRRFNRLPLNGGE